jgi:hypothetical protein
MPELTHSGLPSQTLDADAHNGLPLPGGGKIGTTSTEALRPILNKLGVAGAHTRPKNEIVADYVRMLRKIHDTAGSVAVETFLETHKD